MANVLDVAQYIIDSYKQRTNEDIDELKLHKLLYFCQRESLALTDSPLFEEELQGWVHGPVSTDVRSHFEQGIGITVATHSLSEKEKVVVDTVMNEYCEYASWKLRELSHNEISWINSRKGLRSSDRGCIPLSLDDIRKDAEKVEINDDLFNLLFEPGNINPDPFYSSENISRLEHSISQMELKGGTIHEVLND
ncbi:MAG: Panacea domain-containing protein [Ruminococcus sp.]